MHYNIHILVCVCILHVCMCEFTVSRSLIEPISHRSFFQCIAPSRACLQSPEVMAHGGEDRGVREKGEGEPYEKRERKGSMERRERGRAV